MSNLDPNIQRCAKQIYYNLQLTERIALLNKSQTLPIEISKLKCLLECTGKDNLDTITKRFLQWKAPDNQKKTLNHFIERIDEELAIQSAKNDVQDVIDFDDDLDEEFLLKMTEIETKTTPKVEKRKASQVKALTTEVSTKKMRSVAEPIIQTPPLSPHQCFGSTYAHNDSMNVICSPSGGTRLFTGISWIYLYEIGRFVQSCKISWNEVPFEAFQIFINAANGDPKRLYEVMMQWNQEKRLGKKMNALSYTLMDRCPDNVWIFFQKQQEIASSFTSQFGSSTNSNSLIMSPISPTPSSSSSASNGPPAKTTRLKNRMIHYSGIIQFKTSSEPPIISLMAPKVNASNRLFRKYGQDRFMELKLTRPTPYAIFRKHQDYFLKPFLFMHRIFRFLFLKDDTMVLFATEGLDLEPISIQQVIDWHMPILENWSMSMSKYASRMSLGYSSSIPTLEFKPDEIQYIDDMYGTSTEITDESACMTDGCGIISCSAMRQIMGLQMTDSLPCAIQGRIAGSKGIWIIAPDMDFTTGNYIKIRKSQDKFKTGLLQEDMRLDPLHYTFDLVKNSICLYPSNLNTQFIQCLADGGVPTSVFVDILREYIHRLATVVTENQSVKVLRDWVAKAGNIMNTRWESEEQSEKGLWKDVYNIDDDSDFLNMFEADDETVVRDDPFTELSVGTTDDKRPFHHILNTIYANEKQDYHKMNKFSGFPASLHESVVRLLDSGFDLSNGYVATRVTMIFRQVMKSITTKYKIEVPQSCTVTCVPDPTDTLMPGEVFLQIPSRKTDEKTGIRAGQILGDVIVTRNPCGLKSDIQKVKAVDCTALRMYTDIIIFSTKGETSLASQLGGGDYDGDIVFCCWDERIVKPFNSSPVITETQRTREAFDKDKTTVGGEVGSHSNAEEAIQKNFIQVSIPDGTLGVYENWRTVLAERTSLDDPDVVYLAQMCAKLVDAPKQGLRLKTTASVRDRNNFGTMPHPAWFMDKRNKQRNNKFSSYRDVNSVYTLHDAPCKTTMDYLYDTLLKETEKFTRYSTSIFGDSDVIIKDPDLTAPWLKAQEQARLMNDKDLRHDLDLICETVKINKDKYSAEMFQLAEQKQHFIDNVKDPKKYSETKFGGTFQSKFNSNLEVQEFYSKEFISLPALEEYQSSILIFDGKANNGQQSQILKASFAYIIATNNSRYNKYCYVVAYDTLRRIKADALAKLSKENGLSESVTISAYKSMNIDKKWLKKYKELNYTDDEKVLKAK